MMKLELIVEDGKTFYKVPATKVVQFIEAEAKVDALDQGGVDNWEWYDASMEKYEEIQSTYAELYGVEEAKP